MVYSNYNYNQLSHFGGKNSVYIHIKLYKFRNENLLQAAPSTMNLQISFNYFRSLTQTLFTAMR